MLRKNFSGTKFLPNRLSIQVFIKEVYAQIIFHMPDCLRLDPLQCLKHLKAHSVRWPHKHDVLKLSKNFFIRSVKCRWGKLQLRDTKNLYEANFCFIKEVKLHESLRHNCREARPLCHVQLFFFFSVSTNTVL